MANQIESIAARYQEYASPLACQAIRNLQGFGGPLYLAGIPDHGYATIADISEKFEPFLADSGFQAAHLQTDYLYRPLCQRLAKAGILERRWIRINGRKTYQFAKQPDIVQQTTTAIAGSMLLCETMIAHSLSYVLSSGLSTIKNRALFLAFLADHEGIDFQQKTLAGLFGLNEGHTRTLLEALARAKVISYDAVAYNSGRRPLIFHLTDDPRFRNGLPDDEYDRGLARDMEPAVVSLNGQGITRQKIYLALWQGEQEDCDPKVFGIRIANILRRRVNLGALREKNNFVGAKDLSSAEIADDGLQVFYYLLSPLKDIFRGQLPALQQITKEVQQRVLPTDKLTKLIANSLCKYRPHSTIYKMGDAELTPEIVYAALGRWLRDYPNEKYCQTYLLERLLIDSGNPLSDKTIRDTLHRLAEDNRVTIIKKGGVNYYQPVGYKPTGL